MNKEAKALLRKLVEEGKRHDEVRRGLISEGFSTEGFADEYDELFTELGIENTPKEVMVPPVNPILQEEARKYSKESKDVVQSQEIKRRSNFIKIVTGVFVIVAAVLMLSGIGPGIWQNTFEDFSVAKNTQNPVDIARESQLRTMQLAAEAYRAKLLDYVGVCKSIGVDHETYNCVERGEVYAIEAPLSDGTFFCVDSTGFAGINSISQGNSGKCSQ